MSYIYTLQLHFILLLLHNYTLLLYIILATIHNLLSSLTTPFFLFTFTFYSITNYTYISLLVLVSKFYLFTFFLSWGLCLCTRHRLSFTHPLPKPHPPWGARHARSSSPRPTSSSRPAASSRPLAAFHTRSRLFLDAGPLPLGSMVLLASPPASFSRSQPSRVISVRPRLRASSPAPSSRSSP